MSDIKQYKCPSCGGAIEFNPGLQKLKCPFCESEFEVEILNDAEASEAATAPEDSMEGWSTASENTWSQEDGDAVCSYICQSCGGEILGDANMGATSCPFCGNNVVINEKFAGTLKPDLIIPFKYDKAAAKAALKKHFAGKKLLPKLFKDENHLDEIKGIYVPFWLFDAEVEGAVKYTATMVRHWSSDGYDYTETRYYDVYREGGVDFARIPVDASSKMADDLMDSLEPFDIKEAVDFNTAYFAGYLADKYDVTVDENIPRINTRIKHSTEDIFRGTVRDPYTTVSVNNSCINLKKGNAKYVLLPVWVLNTTWKGQKYIFAMNGQTGKLVGNLPMDKGLYRKYWLIAFLFSLPIGLILAILIILFLK